MAMIYTFPPWNSTAHYIMQGVYIICTNVLVHENFYEQVHTQYGPRRHFQEYQCVFGIDSSRRPEMLHKNSAGLHNF